MGIVYSNDQLPESKFKHFAKKAVQYGLILSVPYFVNKYSGETQGKDASDRKDAGQSACEGNLSSSYGSRYEQRKDCEPLIVGVIAYLENFRSDTYNCGAPTNGYGQTYRYLGNGNFRKVRMGDAPIGKKEARMGMIAHMNNDTYPAVEKYLPRDVKNHQLIAICANIYGNNCVRFSGKSVYGVRVQKPSDFYTALAKGKSDLECARLFNEFIYKKKQNKANQNDYGVRESRKEKREPYVGLMKRNWLLMAMYCGKIDPQELMGMAPGSIYNMNVRDLYYSVSPEKDGYYTPRLDDAVINKFRRMGKAMPGSVYDILDKEMALRIKKSSTYDLASYAGNVKDIVSR